MLTVLWNCVCYPALVTKLEFLYHFMSIYRELTNFWLGDDRYYRQHLNTDRYLSGLALAACKAFIIKYKSQLFDGLLTMKTHKMESNNLGGPGYIEEGGPRSDRSLGSLHSPQSAVAEARRLISWNAKAVENKMQQLFLATAPWQQRTAWQLHVARQLQVLFAEM